MSTHSSRICAPPPPPPPVNPAPPGGARREARQRQAAVQKGEEGGSAEGSSEVTEAGGDRADAPPGPQQSMSRHEGAARGGSPATARSRVRPEPSFTPLPSPARSNPFADGALYGGGIGIAALILALGFTTLRPRSQRRPPEVPAPAWAAAWRRR